VSWAYLRAAPKTRWSAAIFSDSAGGYHPHSHQENALNTAQFARELGIQPESLRKAIAKNGSYYGVTPAKQANGRLVWPADALVQLKGGV
jgi:hypothetical protein